MGPGPRSSQCAAAVPGRAWPPEMSLGTVRDQISAEGISLSERTRRSSSCFASPGLCTHKNT
eukprot:scaffold95151_cov31-Prasinocladus_malaysianus.AAC.1